MGNSIIDQQRDNADLVEVFCVSWSPWLGADFDRASALNGIRFNTYLGSREYLRGSVESIFGLIQHMLESDNRIIRSDPYYWTETVKEDE